MQMCPQVQICTTVSSWTAELLKLGCVVCHSAVTAAPDLVAHSETRSDSAAGQLEVGGRDKIVQWGLNSAVQYLT